MRRLKEDQRNNTIGSLEAGEFQTAIATALKVSEHHISPLG